MLKAPGIVKYGRILLALFILVPIGFYTKSYGGPGAFWVHHYLGGILYEVVWCLTASLFLRHTSPRQIALGVFTVTSILECLQLWHPPILETLRQTLIGHLILGSSFDLWDFPHYVIGSLLGYFALITLHRENQI